jgi:hypothetical protein
MIADGSYELGWRIQEAAPYNFVPIYGCMLQPFHATPAEHDLKRMGMTAKYGDVFDFIGTDRSHDSRLQPSQEVPKPLPDLTNDRAYELPYKHLDNERIVCVGAGAGSLIMASYLRRRGVPPQNITTIDPRNERGGIWTEDWTRFGGFNNPAPLQFDRRVGLSLAGRGGNRMHDYLADLAEYYLDGSASVQGTVVDMQREYRGDKEWIVRTEEGDTFEATSVLLATGRPHPRRIDSGRINSNLDELAAMPPSDEIIVERYQRRLDNSELDSGRPIVLIGLGNSTAAMLNQIHQYEDTTGENVDYIILTDRSYPAVYNPNRSVTGKPVFRQPKQGYLTGYSGDIPRDRESYDRALGRGRIMAEVTDINYDSQEGTLRISNPSSNREYQAPHVFALIGYDRDDQLFRSAGALSRGTLLDLVGVQRRTPEIRACDGAVLTRTDGFMSNLYAVGAAAATPQNPNAAVIPGIQAQAPRTALTIAVRGAVKRGPESLLRPCIKV